MPVAPLTFAFVWDLEVPASGWRPRVSSTSNCVALITPSSLRLQKAIAASSAVVTPPAITRSHAPVPISPISPSVLTGGQSPAMKSTAWCISVEQGETIDQGMQLAVEAILVSPRFLFRIEPAEALDDFQFASRLSYFLWSSMPDEELFQLAAQHRLRDPEILRAQIHRMLLDPKSRSLVDNFGGQWLETRNLDSLQPDPAKFPEFNNELRRDMQQETRLFFQSIIRGDAPISEFLSANYTFLNQRLAAFYGIPNVEGAQFRRVDLSSDSHRGGILTQASVLTVTCYPARTSPVIRGKWILQNLLDSAPPPPPPNVPKLEDTALTATATMRERLEQHRANPACKGCHARMDPLGFSLENYDAIGRWRTRDGDSPIDAGDGPDALKQLLLKDQDRFARALASKLMTYALGRKAVLPSVNGNETFAQLVETIMTSRRLQCHTLRPLSRRHRSEASAQPSHCRCSTPWSRHLHPSPLPCVSRSSTSRTES